MSVSLRLKTNTQRHHASVKDRLWLFVAHWFVLPPCSTNQVVGSIPGVGPFCVEMHVLPPCVSLNSLWILRLPPTFRACRSIGESKYSWHKLQANSLRAIIPHFCYNIIDSAHAQWPAAPQAGVEIPTEILLYTFFQIIVKSTKD